MSRSRLVCALGLAAVLAGCDPEPGAWSIPGEVDCHEDTMPGDYLRQSGGLFTVSELLGRGTGPDESNVGPAIEGMLGGSFSFWKELVEAVPFDHPGNVVCQSLLFEEEAQADAFVESLEADAASLSRASISWPKNGQLTVVEATEGLAEPGPRAFVATGQHHGEPFRLVLLFEAAEQYVIAVHAGGLEQDVRVEEFTPALAALRAEAIAQRD